MTDLGMNLLILSIFNFFKTYSILFKSTYMLHQKIVENADQLLKDYGSPLFVYDQKIISDKVDILFAAAPDFHISYAMKANCNNEILKILRQKGVKSVDVVSPGEIYRALQNQFQPSNILYTENFISTEQMIYALEAGVTFNIGALDTILSHKDKLSGHQIFIRINPDLGAGQNYKVITGGPQSKFGIAPADLNKAIEVCKQAKIKVVGLHQHIGSNLKAKDEEVYLKAIEFIFKVSELFQDLRCVNIGGGFGIKYSQGEEMFDLPSLFGKVREIKNKFVEKTKKDIQIWIEPGRFLMGQCGNLLCNITARKETSQRVFYGTNTGFNHLIRPALYGSHHQIVNVSNPDLEQEIATICGNICESSDNLGCNIQISGKIGDVLCIKNAGAYCFSMSSNYNERPKPAELLIETNGETRIIRRRETFKDLIDKL